MNAIEKALTEAHYKQIQKNLEVRIKVKIMINIRFGEPNYESRTSLLEQNSRRSSISM